MTIPEIPADAMEYAEKACKAILDTTRRLFRVAMGGDYKIIIIAVKKDDQGADSFCLISDYNDKDEMTHIMREAARRSIDGSMIDGDDFKEPKH